LGESQSWNSNNTKRSTLILCIATIEINAFTYNNYTNKQL